MTPGLHWNLDPYVDAIRLWASAVGGKFLGSTTFISYVGAMIQPGPRERGFDAQTCGLSPVVGNNST